MLQVLDEFLDQDMCEGNKRCVAHSIADLGITLAIRGRAYNLCNMSGFSPHLDV